MIQYFIGSILNPILSGKLLQVTASSFCKNRKTEIMIRTFRNRIKIDGRRYF
jgi:hypothetical protein